MSTETDHRCGAIRTPFEDRLITCWHNPSHGVVTTTDCVPWVEWLRRERCRFARGTCEIVDVAGDVLTDAMHPDPASNYALRRKWM